MWKSFKNWCSREHFLLAFVRGWAFHIFTCAHTISRIITFFLFSAGASQASTPTDHPSSTSCQHKHLTFETSNLRPAPSITFHTSAYHIWSFQPCSITLRRSKHCCVFLPRCKWCDKRWKTHSPRGWLKWGVVGDRGSHSHNFWCQGGWPVVLSWQLGTKLT